MNENKPIQLSDSSVSVTKIVMPILYLILGMLIYIRLKSFLISFIISIGGIVLWFNNFRSLKNVKFLDNYLLISNGLKKDNVYINEIESMETSNRFFLLL